MYEEVLGKRIVIFGTGRLYHRIKIQTRKEINVVALSDNDRTKWNKIIDGVTVVPPDQIANLHFDYIYIASRSTSEIRQQLVALGIDMLKVYDYTDNPNFLVRFSGIEKYRCKKKLGNTKRIVLLSHALTSTGANVILFRAASLYMEIGYDVLVISRTDGELLSRYCDCGIEVWVISDLIYYLSDWEKVALEADIIIVNTFWFYYLLQKLDINTKSKIIWWIHETFPFSLINRIQFDLCSEGLRGIAAISPKVNRELRRIYEYDKAEIVPWGIPDRKKSLIAHTKDNVVFAIIGVVDSKIKGQDIFLRAIDSLSDSDREKAEFWIVGAGVLTKTETDIVEKYNCIQQKGFVAQEKIPNLYSHIDVVVCASRQEALSVVTVEAFMNEKLTIVSDAAGVVDYMVPGEDGLIFPSGDHEKLADYMHWAINHMDEARAIGQRSRRVYDKYFTMQAFKERLVQLI